MCSCSNMFITDTTLHKKISYTISGVLTCRKHKKSLTLGLSPPVSPRKKEVVTLCTMLHLELYRHNAAVQRWTPTHRHHAGLYCDTDGHIEDV